MIRADPKTYPALPENVTQGGGVRAKQRAVGGEGHRDTVGVERAGEESMTADCVDGNGQRQVEKRRDAQ